MNPRIPTEPDPQSDRHSTIPPFKITGFKSWLDNRNLNANYSHDIILSLTKYVTREIKEPKQLIDLIARTPAYFRISLRLYVRYLNETETIDDNSAEKYLKLIPRRKINADGRIPTDDEVKTAYNRAPDVFEKLLFKISAYSGLRLTEITKMINEFDPAKLVHISADAVRYPLNWKRGQKSATFCYLPTFVAREIKKNQNLTAEMVKKRISKTGIGGKYLRKWQYNYLIFNGVDSSVADFIQGRSATSVGSAHYLASTRQADQAYARISGVLGTVFE